MSIDVTKLSKEDLNKKYWEIKDSMNIVNSLIMENNEEHFNLAKRLWVRPSTLLHNINEKKDLKTVFNTLSEYADFIHEKSK